MLNVGRPGGVGLRSGGGCSGRLGKLPVTAVGAEDEEDWILRRVNELNDGREKDLRWRGRTVGNGFSASVDGLCRKWRVEALSLGLIVACEPLAVTDRRPRMEEALVCSVAREVFSVIGSSRCGRWTGST